MINLTEYENFVIQMMNARSKRDIESKQLVSSLGICSEAGEHGDIFKKVIFHEQEFTEDIRNKGMKELGDIIFYIAYAAREVYNSSLSEIIEINITKLSERYKTGTFTTAEFLAKEAQK